MKKCSLFVLAMAALLSSCVKDPGAEGPQTGQDAEKRDVYVAPDGSEWVKLWNPYATENIQQAIEALGLTTRGLGDRTLTTHYHVRFRPANDNQFYALLADTLLEFFPYPLDYEAPLGEAIYVDPQQPDDAPPFLFTWVPALYRFADSIAYDIIDPLCLVDDAGVNLFDAQTAEDIVTMSISIDPDIGKYPKTRDPIEPGGSGGGGYSSNFPQGRIRAWDDLLAAYIPLQGVKVRARRWFKVASATTDANGDYVIKTIFENPYNYSIIWETKIYDIRAGSFFQAIYNGPKRHDRWNLDINGPGLSLSFATIHRAAYRYFFQDNGGMRYPYSLMMTKLKLCHHDKSGTGVFWAGGQLSSGFLPDIEIYGKDANGNGRATDRIFSTTAHELTHAAHYIWMGNVNYWQVKKKIYESWADFGEWVVTMQEYTERGLTGNNMITLEDRLTTQWWPYRDSWTTTDLYNSERRKNSPIFIDLLDNFDQSSRNGGTRVYPNDDVTGYTAETLNGIILGIYNASDLKTSLKANKPAGVTDAQIDNLFLRYNEAWPN